MLLIVQEQNKTFKSKEISGSLHNNLCHSGSKQETDLSLNKGSDAITFRVPELDISSPQQLCAKGMDGGQATDTAAWHHLTLTKGSYPF